MCKWHFRCLIREHFALAMNQILSARGREMDLFSNLSQMNIMLMDGDEWTREALSMFFESQGCPIKTVSSLEDGMSELGSVIYDILIVDDQLPGMNSIELLKHVQNAFPNMMTILISAYGNRIYRSLASDAGAWNIVEKPFNMKKIRESLADIVRLKKRNCHDARPCKMVQSE